MKYNFMDFINEVLNSSNKPLSANEIWERGYSLGVTQKLSSSGKTPVRTLAARLYIDIRDNNNSIFYQASKHPAKFYLKSKMSDVADKPEDNNNNCNQLKYSERDLHKLLTTFVHSDQHFKCMVRTIFHEKSKKSQKGKNEWLHPDIVGIYFPFSDYSQEALALYSTVADNPYKLFSFEIKKELNFCNLREYYFQAVSNSSWAHEGYLVTVRLLEDEEFYEELRRLNNSFGIGIIKLDPENVSQSEILFQAHEKKNLDWNTIERLISENDDFKDFVKDISLDTSNRTNRLIGKYDEYFYDEDEAADYSRRKGIIKDKS